MTAPLSPASRAIVLAAEQAAEIAVIEAERDAALAKLEAVRELSERWALGALRLQGSDPDAASWLRMAAAELQDVTDGDHPLITVGDAEMIRLRRSRGH
jgi:hypothetical protein